MARNGISDGVMHDDRRAISLHLAQYLCSCERPQLLSVLQDPGACIVNQRENECRVSGRRIGACRKGRPHTMRCRPFFLCWRRRHHWRELARVEVSNTRSWIVKALEREGRRLGKRRSTDKKQRRGKPGHHGSILTPSCE